MDGKDRDARRWRTFKVPEEIAQVFEKALWVAQVSGEANSRVEAMEALAGDYLAGRLHAFYHDRASRDTPYRLQQLEALEDAGWRCLLCDRSYQLQTHHIRPRSMGGKDDKMNLAVLCASCHAKITNPKPGWHWRDMEPKLLTLRSTRHEELGGE